MAIDITGAPDDKISFGDVAAIAGLTAMTVGITVEFDSWVENNRFASQWGSAAATERAWALVMIGDEIAFAPAQTGGGTFGRKTAGLDVVPGDLIRLVVTWTSGVPIADAVKWWANGVPVTDSPWFGSSNVPSLQDSPVDLTAGAPDATQGAVDCKLSEYAIWNLVLPDRFCRAYGKGLSPRFYRKGGILYAPLVNTSHLTDEWGGILGVNTGGTNAPHPGMYYPIPTGILGLVSGPPPLGTLVALAASDDSQIALAGSDNGLVTVAGSDDSKIPVAGSE